MKTFKIICICFVWLLSFEALAQLAVEKEPHHKVTFENEQVRVIELTVSPSDTTLVHTHSAASVVIFLSESSFAIQNPKQAPVVTHVNNGDVVYRDYDKKPVAHTVWGADATVFRCLVVEIKEKQKQ